MIAQIKTASEQDLAEFGILRNSSPEFNKEERITTDQPTQPNQSYPGDEKDDSGPLKEDGYHTLDYESPALLASVHNEALRTGRIQLYDWQVEQSDEFAASMKTANGMHPSKRAICAANGSGKDAFVVAPLAVWFAVTNIRALVLITSSSGVQLTSQTENYIRTLCQSVNEYCMPIFGAPVFKINQRFIKCLLSGSEIRLFATDEEGKAEGYHPLEPDAKMLIIVNEAKSVSPEIFRALRRCTGFSHWLNVSTPGAPTGDFYKSFTQWPHVRRVDYTMCPRHMSDSERLEDLINEGQHSAYYRSKWLALFTNLDGNYIITLDVVNRLRASPPEIRFQDWPDRVGIDLAAGGDEVVITITHGNKLVKELAFREKDTVVGVNRIDEFLRANKIEQTSEYIYGDDGGVGRSMIDMLVHKGWHINRVLNQSRASRSKQYGNKGAELWDRVKRIFEEGLFNLSGFSDKCIEQLTSRKYKGLTSGKTFLESKKEAKAAGIPSPDRADAFVLSLTGLTIEDFLVDVVKKVEETMETKLVDEAALLNYIEEQRYGVFNNVKPSKLRVNNSLSVAIRN